MRSKQLVAALVLAASAVAATVLIGVFPVYFRADDALYLEWAATHANPLDAFVPARATLFGVFRPLQNLAWWSLYHVFGLHPAPYQAVVITLFIVCLALLGRLARTLFSPAAAWWAIAGFLGLFPYLTSVMFWFADLSFLLETALMLLSIDLLADALAGRRSFGWGMGVVLAAILAKEPAALVVPVAFGSLVLSEWRGLDRPRRTLAGRMLLVLGAMLAAVVVAHPSLHARLVALNPGGVGGLMSVATTRFRAYAGHLVSGAGFVAVALAAYALWQGVWERAGGRSGFAQPGALAACLGGAVALRHAPLVAGALLISCLSAQVAMRRREGVGAAWFVAPLLGLLTISFVARTYLFEAAFGLALFCGAVAANLAESPGSRSRRLPRWVGVAALMLVLGMTVAVGGRVADAVADRLRALELVSAARHNFRAVVGVVEASVAAGETIVVLDYADMALDYERDIMPLGDIAKAERQKTMMSHELAAFLRASGRGDLAVTSMAEYLRRPAGGRAWLFVMNVGEDEYAATLPIERTPAFACTRAGEVAKLFRILTPRM